VTQAQFARLAGVTSQAVYQWERGGARGKLGLRKQTAAALAGLRDLGVREAKARLAVPKTPPVRSKKRAKARRPARKGK
jgi:transcriptional regulator with XRE-family HTH domain